LRTLNAGTATGVQGLFASAILVRRHRREEGDVKATICCALGCVSAVLAAPAPVLAQYTSALTGGTFNNPGSAYLADSIAASRGMSRTIERIKQRMIEDGRLKPGADVASASAPARVPGGTTAFVPGRRAFLDQFAGPRRQEMAKLLSDCEQVYARTMLQSGAAESPAALNDIASSTAFHVVTAHYIYWSDRPGAPAPAQGPHIRTLRNKLRERYVARGTLRGKSDLEKQMAHDGLVVSACIPMVQYGQAKKTGDQPGKQAARRTAGELLTKVGLSPTSVRFNPDGTVRVGAIE
jgi:hypothetical protein